MSLYRGLKPLEADDAGIFFGREAPTRQVGALARLRRGSFWRTSHTAHLHHQVHNHYNGDVDANKFGHVYASAWLEGFQYSLAGVTFTFRLSNSAVTILTSLPTLVSDSHGHRA